MVPDHRQRAKRKREVKIPQPPKKQKFIFKVGWFLIRMVTLTLFLGALALWGYMQIMKQALGKYDLFDWRKPAISALAESQVILLSPLRTQEWLRKLEKRDDWPWVERQDPWPFADTLWYAEGMKRPDETRVFTSAWQQLGVGQNVEPLMIDSWKDWLYDLRIDYRVISEPDLVNLVGTNRVLIIPGALLLSKEEKAGIKNFLVQGGRVLACWSIGTRDENGEWVGFDFLSQLTGALPGKDIRDPAGSSSIVLSYGSPITAMIPPGTHTDFFTYNGYIGLNIVESRTQADAIWWSPYWKSSQSYSSTTNCAILRGSYLDGKFVWFSFMPETVHSNKDNPHILRALIHNSLDYLQDKPIATASLWPDGYRGGAALILNGSATGSLLQQVASVSLAAGISFDLLLDPEFIPSNISYSKLPHRDIILTINNANRLNELPNKELREWFSTQISRVRRLTGNAPVAFHPTNWTYNHNILSAGTREGISNYLAEPQPRCYGPNTQVIKPARWKIFIRKKTAITMPKSQLSMMEYFDQHGKTNPDRLYESMRNDMIRITRNGGLYLGFFEPTLMVTKEMLEIPVRLSEEMDSLGVWQTNLSALLNRYNGWQGIRLSCKTSSSSRVRLQVSNISKISSKNVAIRVYYSNLFDGVNITSENIGVNPTNVRWDKKNGIARFVLPELSGRTNITLYLNFTTN